MKNVFFYILITAFFSFIVFNSFLHFLNSGLKFTNPLFKVNSTDFSNSDLKNYNLNGTIFCMIFVTPQQFKNKGRAVLNTWAPRCDDFRLFHSMHAGLQIKHVKGVPLNVPYGRANLTKQTMLAIQYTMKHHNAHQWYAKFDDDVYVIMENLRGYLSTVNSTKPSYHGDIINNIVPSGYHSGGAGYILSNSAALLISKNVNKLCKNPPTPYEDAEVGRCLYKLGVNATITTDSEGRLRFHGGIFRRLFIYPNTEQWYFYKRGRLTIDGTKKGQASFHVLSDSTVTIHYTDPSEMFIYDFLLYQLRRNPYTRETRD